MALDKLNEEQLVELSLKRTILYNEKTRILGRVQEINQRIEEIDQLIKPHEANAQTIVFNKIRQNIDKIKITPQQQALKDQLIQRLTAFEERLKTEADEIHDRKGGCNCTQCKENLAHNKKTDQKALEQMALTLEGTIYCLCNQNTTVKQKLTAIEEFRNYARGLGQNPQIIVRNIILAEIGGFALFGAMLSIILLFAVTRGILDAHGIIGKRIPLQFAVSLANYLSPGTFSTAFSTAALTLALVLLITIAVTYILTTRNDYALLVNEKNRDRGQELSAHLKKMVEGDTPENKNTAQNFITTSESTSAKGCFFPAAPEPKPAPSNTFTLFPTKSPILTV